MATTSNLQLTAPYSSSSDSSPPTWDVFLSFCGKDTRRNFTSHLYSALVQAGIRTFMDDPQLEKGAEISTALSHAIYGSNIFIVVLSEKYASSRWCLDELVEILTCKRTNGQLVIPVFCYVDPSDIRHQRKSFGEGFESQKNRHVDRIDKWKSALAEIADLSGYHLKKDADEKESNTVQNIVEQVTPLISTKLLDLEDYLVGTSSSVEEIYQKLCMESNEVRAIGICGMGGIGKTTTAKAFYNKYFNNFDISCFIDDVKQLLQGGTPLLALLEQLLNKLNGRMEYQVSDVKRGIRQLKQLLGTKKALIVLDDLDQSSYSGYLVRFCNLFPAGSRIIFTTRDANLANQLKADISGVDIYRMKELKQDDSLELFSYYAFREPTPPEGFKELAVSFITCAGGIPLALKVLGSSLLNRTDVSFWKDKLVQFKEFGENAIQKILQMSYDELDDFQKAIFLDIAFFFVGRNKDEAVHIFQSCGFFPNVGIPVLVERCLLTITKSNTFEMHNLIQDMGKDVIREETKHGNCRHLDLSRGNACVALQNLEGTKSIEGLIIDQSIFIKRHLTIKVFESLPNLRLLEIIGEHDIEGNFCNSFYELRCIRWSHCPWTRLPSRFWPQNLVSLDMPFSKFTTLWKGTTPMVNLKTINLSNSRNLKIMPDFTNLESLEKLLLDGCTSLLQVHPSIGQLTNLRYLNLSACVQLKELTETIGQLTKLGHLDLRGCVNLKRLPEHLGDMKCLKMLDASYTSIEQLPDSIGHLKELVDLKLRECKKLRKLPEQIGNMESLKWFEGSYSGIEHLPDTFSGLLNLDKLNLYCCQNLTSLPNSLWKLKVLRELNLSGSSKLKQLPEQLGKMQCLVELDASGTAIEDLPVSIGVLSRLEVLALNGCKKVRKLPSSIWNLTSLERLYLIQEDMDTINLPDMVKDMKLKNLELSCNLSLWLPVILSFTSLERLTLHYESQSFSPNEPYSLSKLSNLQHLTLIDHKCSFPELPLNLTELWIFDYETLEMLPDLSSLEQLKSLYIGRCSSLQSLSTLPPHLEDLGVNECTSLQDLPDVSVLKELRSLSLLKFNLKSNSLKQSFLQVGQHKLHQFEADIANREVPEWLSYKSSGNTLSFTIPPNSGDNLFGIGLWIVYKCKYADGATSYIKVVITNKTKDIKMSFFLLINNTVEVQSKVKCLTREEISVKGGDRIKVSVQRFLVNAPFDGCRHSGEVKVKMCGAHLIHKTPTTPSVNFMFLQVYKLFYPSFT